MNIAPYNNDVLNLIFNFFSIAKVMPNSDNSENKICMCATGFPC